MRRLGIAALVLLLALAAAGFWLLYAPALPEPQLAGELRQAQWQGPDGPRQYRYYLPDPLPPAAPILLVLHGSDGDGRRIRRWFGYRFEALAQRDGFIAVYPDGFQRYWNGCRAAGPYAANEQNIDDVAFLTGLAQDLARHHGADAGALFATGLSNGGHMAMRLALEAPAQIRAFAPVAANLPAQSNFGCQRAGQAVSAFYINGTADPINPYAGGSVTLFGFGNRGDVLSAMDSAAYWRALAGLSAAPQVSDLPDTNPDDATRLRLHEWSGAEHRVRLLEVIGGGHTIPSTTGRMPRILGPTNPDLDAADAIWAFFRAQRPTR